MSSLNSVGDRIKDVMNKELMNYRSFGKKIGYSDVVVGNIIKNRNKPSFDFIFNLIQTYNWIDHTWLLTGRGKMLKTGKEIIDNNKCVETDDKTSVSDLRHTIKIQQELIDFLKEENKRLKTENLKA